MISAEGGTSAEKKQADDACRIVGELILISSALDHQFNKIVVALLSLGAKDFVEPVVATLDMPRKLEMVKGYMKHMSPSTWHDPIKRHVEAIESVSKQRNLAAHSVLNFQDGKAILTSSAATRILRALDMKTKTINVIHLQPIVDAIRRAERALREGQILLLELQRLERERARVARRGTGKRKSNLRP